MDAVVESFIRDHEFLHGVMILDAVAPSDGPRDDPLDYRFGDYGLPDEDATGFIRKHEPIDYMTVTEEEIDRILALRPPRE
jgi:hypothetical protein